MQNKTRRILPKNIFVLLLLLLAGFAWKTLAFSLFRQKQITIDKFGPCADSDSDPIQLLLPFQVVGHGTNVTFDGRLNVTIDVPGPFDLMIETHRCSLDMKECINYDQLTVAQMCRKFDDKNAFWTSFMNHFQPKLTCPIKKGMYLISNATLDLGIISKFPIDGYKWIPYIRFITNQKNKKDTKFCIASEITIINERMKKKSSNN